ncbi:transcription initiation factor TFIID subunit 12 [Papilio machaon]|nr:transcription initiation factor TFIID subunit 12 [Papilio machaon]
MSNNSIGSNPSMPSIGNLNPQSAIQYVNNPLQSPQIQATSIQSSPSQHSPMGTQSQVSGKVIQGGGGDQPPQIVNKPRLQELVREVDPTVQLDDEVEDLMLQMADDFIDTSLGTACSFAKHRHSSNVELKDVQLLLERQWNMWIPGFGNDELRPYKRAAITEAHKQRMALIRKTSKKY